MHVRRPRDITEQPTEKFDPVGSLSALTQLRRNGEADPLANY